jgi:thioesterase domain-containing protein
VSLLARIQQLTDRRLPLAMIFQAPTIEQQAALLRQTAPPAWSSLVPLQPSGSAPPFFCVHPAGGNITAFAQLARHLGDDQPFYGLQAAGLDGAMVPFTQIEAMAAYYVEELRRVRPEGPYLLGGWSMGGLVAFEMAQQLRRQGETVALLALLDTPSKRPDEHRPHPAPLIDLFAQDLGRFNKEIPLLAPLSDPPDVERQLRSILDRARCEDLLPMSVGLAELRQLYGVFEANIQARDSYVPQAYAGRVTLFRAGKALGNRPIGVDLSWRALVPDGLTIQIVPGDHYTMLQEPQVQILAQQLKTCIDESLDPRTHDGAAGTSAGAAITLLSRGGDQKVDTLLREIVGRYEAAFPSRIRACYLSGSYAMGGVVPDSDLDMIVVFTGSAIDDDEQEKAREVYQSCSILTPLDLSIDILAEAELISHANVFKAATVKMASTLIYGEDIRDAIVMPPAELYTRTMMNAAFVHAAQPPLVPFPLLSRLRRAGGAVVFPLDYPDPTGEFYGYDLYRGADGSVCSGTKALVKCTRDMARAIVARVAGPYTTVTSAYARTYRERVGGEWAELIEDIYETCKQRWRYQIPTDAHDRRKLRELCRQALGFENHFLAIYRDHLLGELDGAEEEPIILAVKKLGESVYPDDQIIARLRKLAAGSSIGIREAVEKTIKRIVKARPQPDIPGADPASDARAPVDPSRWMAYAGTYRGDTLVAPIAARVYVGEGVLWVYVPALAAKIPCSPFDDRCFDSIYGFVEFREMEEGAPQEMTVDVTGGGVVTLMKESR